MIKLYNATAHDQTPFIDSYKNFGFEFDNPAPLVMATGPDKQSQIEEGRRVASLIPESSCVLIGGAQIIMESIVYELSKKNCRFFTTLSERIRAKNNAFVFNLKAVTESYLSDLIRSRKIKIT